MSALIDRCRRSTDAWQGVRSAGERALWWPGEWALVLARAAAGYELEGDALEDIPADTLFSVWNEAANAAGVGWSTEWNYDGPRFNLHP